MIMEDDRDIDSIQGDSLNLTSDDETPLEQTTTPLRAENNSDGNVLSKQPNNTSAVS